MALVIVLQHTGLAVCQECVWFKAFKCPNPWMHKATGFCPDCEILPEIRDEHHDDCAIRAICKLALTKSPEGRSRKLLLRHVPRKACGL